MCVLWATGEKKEQKFVKKKEKKEWLLLSETNEGEDERDTRQHREDGCTAGWDGGKEVCTYDMFERARRSVTGGNY